MTGSRDGKENKEIPERKKLGEQQPQQQSAQPMQPVANVNQPAEPDADTDPAADQEEKKPFLVAQVKKRWFGPEGVFGAADQDSGHWWSIKRASDGEIISGKPVFSADNERPQPDPNDPNSEIKSTAEVDKELNALPEKELEGLLQGQSKLEAENANLIQSPKAAELGESGTNKVLAAAEKVADATKKMSDEPAAREKLSGSRHAQDANQSQGLSSSGAEMKKQEEVKADNRTTPKPPQR